MISKVSPNPGAVLSLSFLWFVCFLSDYPLHTAMDHVNSSSIGMVDSRDFQHHMSHDNPPFQYCIHMSDCNMCICNIWDKTPHTTGHMDTCTYQCVWGAVLWGHITKDTMHKYMHECMVITWLPFGHGTN